jgi:glycosyltransferase involved in cell wall biosynthesis
MADLVASSVGRACAVAPLGVDHGVFRAAPKAGSEIVCVADFYRHKRHDVLIEAWRSLPTPRPVLRLIGNPAVDAATHAHLLRRIAGLSDSGTIIVESGLNLSSLVDAYRRARLFVLASERESFCMPLVEAMSCGVPGVVRDLASLRETGGGATRYVRGDRPADWEAAIRSMLEDDSEHSRLRRAAQGQAARFSWARFAATVGSGLFGEADAEPVRRRARVNFDEPRSPSV